MIDSKKGAEKVLYSGEVARLLARTAVHERCSAESEKRPMDREMYAKYYKTALYVARKGIDIGIQLAYDAHDKGSTVPDFLYNHYMGWIYIHYSMMLLETHRYFAAMGAVINAENFLVHDYS